MTSSYIQEYERLINNGHAMHLQLFKTAQRFDTILASFCGLRTCERHTAFAKTILDQYELFREKLERMALDFSEDFYRGLKRDKKERRELVFLTAYKCCLSGAFYSKDVLMQAVNRDAAKCPEGVPLEETLELVGKAYDAKLGIEYRFAEELYEFDYYAMELAMEFSDLPNVETRLLERLKTKSVEVPENYDLANLIWDRIPDTEQAISTAIRKDFSEEMKEMLQKYVESGIDDADPEYLARGCYFAYLLRRRGWVLEYGSESEIVLVHDGHIMREYM